VTADECCSGLCSYYRQSCVDCFVQYEPCASDAECCAGYCHPDAVNGDYCDCIQNPGSCASDADCCSGICSTSLTCNYCRDDGESCANGEFCCNPNSVCDSGTLTCEISAG